MNRNSLLALATLIALLWIESGDCKMQNDYEVDIAKRQKGLQIVNTQKGLQIVNPDQLCKTLKNCQEGCIRKEGSQYKVHVVQNCVARCGKITIKEVFDRQFECGLMGPKPKMADEDEADEDEADEAKSDEVDIAKRQKGLKILKAWKRDEAEMADVDEADEARSDKLDIAKRQKYTIVKECDKSDCPLIEKCYKRCEPDCAKWFCQFEIDYVCINKCKKDEGFTKQCSYSPVSCGMGEMK